MTRRIVFICCLKFEQPERIDRWTPSDTRSRIPKRAFEFPRAEHRDFPALQHEASAGRPSQLPCSPEAWAGPGGE